MTDPRAEGLKPNQRRILEAFQAVERATLREIAEQLDIHPNGMSQSASRLLDRGLLEHVGASNRSFLDCTYAYVSPVGPIVGEAVAAEEPPATLF